MVMTHTCTKKQGQKSDSSKVRVETHVTNLIIILVNLGPNLQNNIRFVLVSLSVDRLTIVTYNVLRILLRIL